MNISFHSVYHKFKLTDLGTQEMYQRMDPSFVGLIFAVFLTDQSTKAHKV